MLVDAQPMIEVPADARVTLEVLADGDAWQVGGTAACNSYGGTVVTDGITTCAEVVIAQENHVLSVLGDGFRAEVDGRRLTLISRDGLGLTYRAAGGDGEGCCDPADDEAVED